jgi:hypothetical protein
MLTASGLTVVPLQSHCSPTVVPLYVVVLPQFRRKGLCLMHWCLWARAYHWPVHWCLWDRAYHGSIHWCLWERAYHGPIQQTNKCHTRTPTNEQKVTHTTRRKTIGIRHCLTLSAHAIASDYRHTKTHPRHLPFFLVLSFSHSLSRPLSIDLDGITSIFSFSTIFFWFL